MVYLQDSADDPILDRRRIDHSDFELGAGEFVPFVGADQPFTVWPMRLLALPDMDGNSADELWTSMRFYHSLYGEYESLGAQILFMQKPGPAADPAARSPVLHASPLPREHAPTSARILNEFGSIVARIGDRNGDGYWDMLVTAGRDCEVRVCLCGRGRKWMYAYPTCPAY